MERDRDSRMTYDVRSCILVIINTTKIQYIADYGVFNLKGKSVMISERHSNLKYKFENRHFWAEGYYYVSTVGLNTAIIQKYIREQEKEDQIMDKLKTKEYVNSFKCSK